MADLIERAAALEKMCGNCKSGYDGHCPNPFGMCNEYESILQVPAIEAEPVRHGRFERRITPLDCECKCSECGYRDFVPPEEDYNHGYWFRRKYCPNCGARMDGGAENA